MRREIETRRLGISCLGSHRLFRGRAWIPSPFAFNSFIHWLSFTSWLSSPGTMFQAGVWRWKWPFPWPNATQSSRVGPFPFLSWFAWQYHACHYLPEWLFPSGTRDLWESPFSQNLQAVFYLNSKVTVAWSKLLLWYYQIFSKCSGILPEDK